MGFNEGFGLSSVMFPHPVVCRGPAADCFATWLIAAGPWAEHGPVPSGPGGLGVPNQACPQHVPCHCAASGESQGLGH